nr:PREDICTED: uncharacterized protein LOC100882819 [Megachile rotundata]
MSFYRFNSFTGRLTQVSQNQALNPLAPNKLQTTEVPSLIYDSIKTKPVQTAVRRHKSTLHPRMEQLYKKFQEDMTKPSYLLRGTSDLIIFRICVALTTISLGFSAYYFIELKKKF